MRHILRTVRRGREENLQKPPPEGLDDAIAVEAREARLVAFEMKGPPS